MPDIKFETDTYAQRRRFQRAEMSATQRFIIKNSGGLVKSKREANYALLGFVLLALVASWVILSGGEEAAREERYTPDTEYSGQTLPDNYR